MKPVFIAIAVASALMLATPAVGQQAAQRSSAQMSPADAQAADKAAKAMIQQIYVIEPVPYRTPTEVIAKLQQLGYTRIHDFDVEWGYYEVEATAPGGREVEIKVDPRTGAIIDIDDNLL